MHRDHADQFAPLPDDWHRHDRLELFLFQFGEVVKARIFHRLVFQDHRLQRQTYPACNPFSQTQFNLSYQVFILFTGARQHQSIFVLVIEVNEGCMARNSASNDIYQVAEYFIKFERRAYR